MEKIKYMINENIYIVRIVDFKSAEYHNKSFERSHECSEICILKLEIYTHEEWIEKYYPYLKYCEEWWKYSFTYKTLHLDYAQTGYGNWKKSEFIPCIEDKLYIYWDGDDIYVTEPSDPNYKKKTSDVVMHCEHKNIMRVDIKKYEIKINRKNLDLVLAGILGIDINKIYTTEIETKLLD